MQAWARRCGRQLEWLTEDLDFVLGDATAAARNSQASRAVSIFRRTTSMASAGMSSLWIPLMEKSEELGVNVAYEARAVELIYNYETKEVCGIRTEDSRTFKGRRGLFSLAAASPAIPTCFKTTWPPWDARSPSPWAPPYNVGDGVRMAQQIGAAVAYEQLRRLQLQRSRHQPRFPHFQYPYPVGIDYILVNGEGERFMYEGQRSIQRHGKQKDRGVAALIPIPTGSHLIMGGQCGANDIFGAIT